MGICGRLVLCRIIRMEMNRGSFALVICGEIGGCRILQIEGRESNYWYSVRLWDWVNFVV